MLGTTYLSIYLFGVCDTKKGQPTPNLLEINSNEPDVSKINENSSSEFDKLDKGKTLIFFIKF